MSSSPPSLVPDSFASSHVPSLPPSSHHGSYSSTCSSAASTRVAAPVPSHPRSCPSSSSSSAQHQPQQRHNVEHDEPADAAAAASSSSSSPSQLSLNPLAKEFVPTVLAPSIGQGYVVVGDNEESGAFAGELFVSDTGEMPGVDSERVSWDHLEANDCDEQEGSIKSKQPQTFGGLSNAFRRGHTGGRSCVAAIPKGSQDAASNQSITNAGIGKRGQFTNANHLLNFQYDPIVRNPVPRAPFVRRSHHKVQPYNKELFLQANFRFLVSDFGDYMVNVSDPDKMIQWEDIAGVSVSAPIALQCPICLETPPVCPQITSCGHIFCFACILRYLAIGEGEQKSEYIKKCPLCFAITSSKALRTVFISDVHNYQVGDCVEFTLLNRAKGSMIPFEKSNPIVGLIPYSKDGQCHPFSKFTLTSDAETIANRAIAELLSWGDKAQEEAGEDLDLLPYVHTAIDHLQERKVAWGERRVSEFLSSSPPVRQRIMGQTRERPAHTFSQSTHDGNIGPVQKENADIATQIESAMAELKDRASWVYENAFSDDEDGDGSHRSRPKEGILKHTEPSSIPSSWEDKLLAKVDKPQTVPAFEKLNVQDSNKDLEDKDSYAFYQSVDGQPLILHPLNMKCLLQHYESYDDLPSRFRARIVEMEGQVQTEATRKRYRYLSHLPSTTSFWLCEVDLRGKIPSSVFAPFAEELRSREARRRRRVKQEQADRAKDERWSVVQTISLSPPGLGSHQDVTLEDDLISASDFEGEALSTSPVLDQRKLFSQVTRLGFASAHDAPDLMPSSSIPSSSLAILASNEISRSPMDTVTGKQGALSFADIIQAQPSKPAGQNVTSTSNGASQSLSKKNKKAAKVLLSTAGGRRY